MPASYVLLVIEDDLIANRIATLIGSTYSIVRYQTSTNARKWLTDSQAVQLVILDRLSGQSMSQYIRSNADYQVVPVLIACRFSEVPQLRPALGNGVTDLLIISEETDVVQRNLTHYLSLHTHLRTLSAATSTPEPRFKTPWWKRGIDIAVSFTILLLLSPLLLVVAILIRLDSRGPIIYKSKRAGANFHVFDMYKFRTMKASADKLISQMASQNIYASATVEEEDPTEGAMPLCSSCRAMGISCQNLLFDQDKPVCEKVYLMEGEKAAKFMKFRNDPRITRLGGFLRNSSIDELPQLVNILVGDMSVVGNRPLPLYEAEKLTTDEYARRFAGPAGLTGLWQVKKRAKGQGPMSDRERTMLDIEYSDTFSFRTDVLIIWKTFFSLWQKENV